MQKSTLKIETQHRQEALPITDRITAILSHEGWQEGMLHLWCPHTTAALYVNEQADPDVASDINRFLAQLIPHRHDWSHSEGNSDAHVKSVLVGPGLLLPVEGYGLVLGHWQGVFFAEFDGPRQRQVWCRFLPK